MGNAFETIGFSFTDITFRTLFQDLLGRGTFFVIVGDFIDIFGLNAGRLPHDTYADVTGWADAHSVPCSQSKGGQPETARAE